MSLRLLLNESITILEPGIVKDASGGADLASKPAMNTYVRGRVNPTGSAEQVAWGTQVFVHTHTVYTYQDGVKPGYLVKDASGKFYEVKGVRKFRGIRGLSTYYALGCQEVET